MKTAVTGTYLLEFFFRKGEFMILPTCILRAPASRVSASKRYSLILDRQTVSNSVRSQIVGRFESGHSHMQYYAFVRAIYLLGHLLAQNDWAHDTLIDRVMFVQYRSG